jgi:hypothetical protein
MGCGGGERKPTKKQWEKKFTLGVGGVDTGGDTKCKGFSFFFPLFVVVGVHFVFLFTLSP